MNVTNQIGLRISQQRKELGLTQTDLARALNISPQAVSKWENGLGSPDISLLPEIGQVLHLSMDQLLGTSPMPKGDSYGQDDFYGEEKSQTYSFPESYQGLDFILSYKDRACYANFPAEEIKDNTIRFPDGSEVDLKEGFVYNRGRHKIEVIYWESIGQGQNTESKEEIGYDTNNPIKGYKIDLAGYAQVNILTTDEKKHYWKADGSDKFLEALEYAEEGEYLTFRLGNFSRTNFFFDLLAHRKQSSNRLDIYCPSTSLENLDLTVRGSSEIRSEIAFKNTKAVLSGSSDINLADAGKIDLRMSGAGDAQIDQLDSGKITLSGAGDIELGHVRGPKLDIQISGAGDCDIHSGEIEYFRCVISGAGDVDAAGLTTQDAETLISGFGDMTIGRVKGESREQINKGSKLTILQRG